MDFYEAVRQRRSVRRYRPDPVPRETLLRILQAANWAPSGMNLQQWEFIVVLDPEKRRQLGASFADYLEKSLAGADAERRQQLLLFIQFARNYGNAPIIIVALTKSTENRAEQKMHLESVSAAFQNLLLAARSEGLGSCWMTGPLHDESRLREILNIGSDREIVALTPIGFPEEWPDPPPRKDPELQHQVLWVE